MVNPIIISYSKEVYYPANGEGCLSVLGPMRGKVRRHCSIRIQYQDIDGKTIESEAEGFEAHIIQHEYDHLQGIVYLQKIFNDCTQRQKLLIIALLNKELERRKNYPNKVASNEPVLIFDRQEDYVIFQEATLSRVLTQLEVSTLLGMLKCL